MEDLLVVTVTLVVIVAIVIVGIAVHQDNMIESQLQAILNQYTNLISVNGMFSSEMKAELERDIALYGDFGIEEELYIYQEGLPYDPFYDEVAIIDVGLKVSDRVVVRIIYNDQTLFRRFSTSIASLERRVKGRKSIDSLAIISKDY